MPVYDFRFGFESMCLDVDAVSCVVANSVREPSETCWAARC